MGPGGCATNEAHPASLAEVGQACWMGNDPAEPLHAVRYGESAECREARWLVLDFEARWVGQADCGACELTGLEPDVYPGEGGKCGDVDESCA